MSEPLNIAILGLSITSSWGNGHATVYRSLVRALVQRGHQVLFLERDVPWYASQRDLPEPPYGRTQLYRDLPDLEDRFTDAVRDADAVIVGSYVPQGVEVGQWVNETAKGVTAFYDIDTPVTLAKLKRGDYEYLHPDLIPRYQLYLSFTGGPILRHLEEAYGSPRARPLYCCFDPEYYFPEPTEPEWDLGYMGTYSDDRQPKLERMMLDAARQWPRGRFVVAGPQYPDTVAWPQNVQRIDHLPPAEHKAFYNKQRFTLNITRADMVQAGYAPSVRLFEAAACGTPIISDPWQGLDEFFEVGREILISSGPRDTLHYLRDIPEEQRVAIGLRARQRVLTHHTARHRAAQLEGELRDLLEQHQKHNGGAKPMTQTHPVSPGSDETQQAIASLGPWFHNIHLPDGAQTAPGHFLGDFPSYKWRQIADHLPQNLTGWSVLDIGCNAGFYCVELAKRGAEVMGIDHDAHYLNQARWVAEQFGLEDQIEFRQMQVYQLNQIDRTFDLVLFMGVFYHLRYPLLGLDLVAEKVGRLCVFQTLTMPGTEVYEDTGDRDINDRDAMLDPGWPKMAFIEHRLAGDPTNWWAPNHAAVEAMLRSAGLQVIGRPAHEIYLCQPDPSTPSAAQTWDRAELLAATGRPWECAVEGIGG